MKFRRLLHNLTKVEKIIFVFLVLVLATTVYQIAVAFYDQNSEMDFIPGGVYIEGAVGQVGVLNPLFVQQGSIAHDLTQLIFSGLTRYNTETGEVVGDLANVKAEPNGKKYTFVVKEGAKWHDGEKVTADDVLFTYNDIIKHPEFQGNILNYNDYSGIKINKIDNRTVEFLLEKPDSFFLVKTMVGIMPKHLLINEQVSFLDTAPFNFAPVGTGRYKFVSQVKLADHSEFGLEAFNDFYDGPANIESIVFKVFTAFEDLQKNLSGLTGIRSITTENSEAILKKGHFSLERYQLPQYVAIFINNEAPKLKNSTVRLAMQLGTDKQSLIEEINQHKIIDTPLLEINQESWVNQYSITKANGALFETPWQVPNKDDEEEEVEEVVEEDISPTAEVTYINSPNEGKDWATSREPITITGTVPKNTKGIIINDYELQKYVPGDPGWSYVAASKFDSLVPGENVYEVYAVNTKDEKILIDSITINYASATILNEEKLDKVKEENKEAEILPVRVNEDGEPLSLRLITSSKPEIYRQVALEIKKQWQLIGVNVVVEVLENGDFQERLNSRNYDLLIFGQNLGYNLDAYPYWHSSQAREGGINFSQFKNFVVDSLLEKARLEEADERQETLEDIQEIISQEVPAIFLYSPTLYTALAEEVNHPPFNHLATISDRLGSIEHWYAKVDRKFKDGVTPITFFTWISKQF